MYLSWNTFFSPFLCSKNSEWVSWVEKKSQSNILFWALHWVGYWLPCVVSAWPFLDASITLSCQETGLHMYAMNIYCFIVLCEHHVIALINLQKHTNSQKNMIALTSVVVVEIALLTMWRLNEINLPLHCTCMCLCTSHWTSLLLPFPKIILSMKTSIVCKILPGTSVVSTWCFLLFVLPKSNFT